MSAHGSRALCARNSGETIDAELPELREFSVVVVGHRDVPASGINQRLKRRPLWCRETDACAAQTIEVGDEFIIGRAHADPYAKFIGAKAVSAHVSGNLFAQHGPINPRAQLLARHGLTFGPSRTLDCWRVLGREPSLCHEPRRNVALVAVAKLGSEWLLTPKHLRGAIEGQLFRRECVVHA